MRQSVRRFNPAPSSAVAWAKNNAVNIALIAGVGALIYVLYRGVGKTAEDVARGAVSVGRGATTGVVDEVGKIVGVPSVYDVTNDPYVARYMIDHPRGGYFQASFYSTPVALARALVLPEFSGRMPPQDSRIYREFPPDGGPA
jgi:hypothetical protein